MCTLPLLPLEELIEKSDVCFVRINGGGWKAIGASRGEGYTGPAA